MNEKLIQQLRNGEIAVINDGSVLQLNKVLKSAFPKDTTTSLGFFKSYSSDDDLWFGDDLTDLPKVSINEFFKTEENETT